MFGSILILYENVRRNIVIKDIQTSLQELTTQHSASIGNEIFSNQTLAIQDSLTSIIDSENINILAISVYDDSGQFLVSSDNQFRQDLDDKTLLTLSSTTMMELGKSNKRSILRFDSSIIAYGERVGFWNIEYSIAQIQKQTNNIILIFFASILSLSIILLWLINSILVRFVMSPIQQLQNTMQLSKEEEVSSSFEAKEKRIDKMLNSFQKLPFNMRPSDASKNEIHSLAYSFQQMLFALKSSYIGIRSDSLTGLANRIRLDDVIEREINMEQRYLYSFSILLIDIDYFKEINDNYGHLIGDDVLKSLAILFRNSFRKSDVIGRWGGEEFLVLLPRQNCEQAALVAENFRKIVQEFPFLESHSITVSFGVAQYKHGEKASDLIKRADDALYKAKALGRNRVEVS
ncbi:GGDEF domain-containing protein [Vibrio sp. TH_r3]|uniref:GGDEF domain-containing protein n=1 Tax=Vibrio sp. TH_r3 TaxID=3082084 RepID=UPI002953DD67|nr:GGDEF domain-containing protein [Vibrio sp. TH_r3]MDV7105270.1 GGDEF domain-containing protein [Vibrio sp. TH_r3]